MTDSTSPERDGFYERWRAESAQHAPPINQVALLERITHSVSQKASPPPVSRLRRQAISFALPAIAAAAVAAFAFTRPETPPAFSAGSATGQIGEKIVAPHDTPLPLTFPEGSVLTLAGGSEATVVSANSGKATMRLNSGTVRAHVIHQDHTDYSIQAGPYGVRVTGTQFTVTWTDSVFRLLVTEGSVRVTSPQGAPQDVQAGGRCEGNDSRVECTTLVRDLPAADLSIQPPSQDASKEPAPLPSDEDDKSPPPPRLTWQQLEKQGKYREALEAAQRSGLATILSTASADDLMRLASVARLAGRGDTSTEALLRCRDRFGGSSHAARAAFLLGRNNANGTPIRWFSTYLNEAPGGPLAQEASGRLVELYHRAGRATKARDAAKKYLNSYPDGPHAEFARRLAGK